MLDKPCGKVLDVGCGPGVMAESLLRLGCEFWGVDASPKMIELARSAVGKTDRTHFALGDAMRLDLPSDFFDAVLCMGVIDGLPDRRRALKEMLRVLKPGGTLIVTFANLCSPYAWWKKYVFYPAVSSWRRLAGKQGKPGDRLSSPPDARQRGLFSERKARALVASEGAKVTESAGYYVNPFISPLDEIWPSAALWVTRKLEESRWLNLDWMAAGLILKAQKI